MKHNEIICGSVRSTRKWLKIEFNRLRCFRLMRTCIYA